MHTFWGTEAVFLALSAKARRHADMSIRHFGIGIHVVISTSSILLDIQTRHGGDGSKRVDKDEMR